MNTWQLGEWVILRPGWVLVAIVLFIASFLIQHKGIQGNWQRVLSPSLFDFLGADTTPIRGWNLTLLLATLAALSLSQPAQRQSDDDTWRHSIGWIAIADVSRSMTLDDTVPSRLGAAREALAELSTQAGARPIALILFSGDAFLVAPPAFDRSVFDEHATLLEHGVIPVEGSNLARALSLATSVIEDSQFRAARVFVLGDTGGIGKSSMAAARFLADEGHRVDTLVFGSHGKRTVISNRDDQTGSTFESWSDADSGIDETQVSWQQARLLATAGNGISVTASPFGVIDYSELNLQSQATASTHAELKSLVWREQSHWFLLLAIPLLLLVFWQEARH